MTIPQTVFGNSSKSAWLLLGLLLVRLCPGALPAETLVPSNAMITSRMGSVAAVNADGNQATPGIRDIILPTGTRWSTSEGATTFMAFSNGVGLGIDAETEVLCVEYSQRPFRESKQGFEYEPSVSKLHLQLSYGQIALSSNQLSPLSDLRVFLPVGSLKVHKGNCVIRYDSLGLFLAASEGNLTYEYPDGSSREFITAGKTVRISDQSAALRETAESGSIDELEDSTLTLLRATKHASRRVLFEANEDTGNPPRAVMIVRPEYFEQPASRPYQFLD
jgi:hypothetical protein